MRLIFGQLRGWKIRISIHASRMGCDVEIRCCHRLRAISIHASRMGCDANDSGHTPDHANFNPRIPYGMRQAAGVQVQAAQEFQSTHPVWDATARNV